MEIIQTDDGSSSLRNPGLDETYHSRYGAITESEYVFIKNGLEFCKKNPINAFEVGFGTGLNALLSAQYAFKQNHSINYTSIEKYPVPIEICSGLNYFKQSKSERGIFDLLHRAEWNKTLIINKYFSLYKIEGDLTNISLERFSNQDIIFFDAFSPSKQPEMWQTRIFNKLFEILVPGGILVTYSSSGMVKNALREACFEIKRLKGPPGKHHMLRALKPME